MFDRGTLKKMENLYTTLWILPLRCIRQKELLNINMSTVFLLYLLIYYCVICICFNERPQSNTSPHLILLGYNQCCTSSQHFPPVGFRRTKLLPSFLLNALIRWLSQSLALQTQYWSAREGLYRLAPPPLPFVNAINLSRVKLGNLSYSCCDSGVRDVGRSGASLRSDPVIISFPVGD